MLCVNLGGQWGWSCWSWKTRHRLPIIAWNTLVQREPAWGDHGWRSPQRSPQSTPQRSPHAQPRPSLPTFTTDCFVIVLGSTPMGRPLGRRLGRPFSKDSPLWKPLPQGISVMFWGDGESFFASLRLEPPFKPNGSSKRWVSYMFTIGKLHTNVLQIWHYRMANIILTSIKCHFHVDKPLNKKRA